MKSLLELAPSIVPMSLDRLAPVVQEVSRPELSAGCRAPMQSGRGGWQHRTDAGVSWGKGGVEVRVRAVMVGTGRGSWW